MTTEELREVARRLFEESLDRQEEKTDAAPNRSEADLITAYFTGWREALLELFPDLDVDDPSDFPLP